MLRFKIILLAFVMSGVALSRAQVDQPLDVIEIDKVWAGHSVPFTLYTHGDQQFVGYYNSDRQMVIAQRTLGEKEWKKTPLDSFVGWDSHNSIHLAIDSEGFIHVSGNMHVDPLVYFRSDKPMDASTLRPLHHMTGKREQRATYPRFFTAPDGAMVFSYRDGSSGSGDTLYNLYDSKTKRWKRLLDEPLLDGQGDRNAYPLGPTLGPDGYYHMSWVWRDTIHAETNHNLSYARSRDLVNWETAGGEPLKLPLTLETKGLIVDPIPSKGGILNGSGNVGFDVNNNVVIAYHKFDKNGNTQLYLARFIDGRWRNDQLTDWEHRWYPSGGGSISRDLRHGPFIIYEGRPAIRIQHLKYGSGTFAIDMDTMKLAERLPSSPNPVPVELRQPQSDFPEMRVLWQSDYGTPPEGVSYRLRWEALPMHRDAARPKPWPEPSTLSVLVLPPQP